MLCLHMPNILYQSALTIGRSCTNAGANCQDLASSHACNVSNVI